MKRFFFLFFISLFFVSSCTKSKYITVRKNCLDVKEDLSWTTSHQDVLVLYAGETTLIDEENKILLKYEGDSVGWPMVSPDGKALIASIGYDETIVRETDGTITKIDYYGSWIDKETLIITPPYFDSVVTYRDTLRNDAPPLGTVYLYKPFTNELEKIPSTFAELYPLKYRVSSDGKIRTLNPILDLNKAPLQFFTYNSSLSRVLLFTHRERMRYILWDTQKEEIVWEKELNSPRGKPKWSPDGTQVAVTDISFSSGIVLVDIKGQETEFAASPETYRITGSTLDWSPDGRYIAGYWAEDENYSLRLTVLDTKTKKMVDYCIEGGGDIIWSPDGEQIAVYVEIDKGGGSAGPGTVVVDLENETAVRVSNSLYPVGWMLANE